MTRHTADYMQNAQECRRLADVVGVAEHRDALMTMAAAWEDLVRAKQRPDNRPALIKSMDES